MRPPLAAPLAVLLSALASSAHAGELIGVYERALEQDMQFQAARHARDAAIEALPQARAALLPQINGSYGYQDQSESGTEGFGGLPEQDVDRDSTLKALTVTLDQALFDWAAFKRYAQAGDQVALAQTQFRGAEQALLLRTAQTYFGALSAADNLRLARAEKAAFARQLDQGRQRFEVGLAAITETQEAQARYDLSVAQEITAEQQLANAREALTEITGSAENRLVTLQDEIPLRGPTPERTEVWLQSALEKSPEVIAADLQAEIARKGIGVAQAGHLPTIGAQAEYQDANADGGRFTGDLETETLGVQVRLPIFAGLATQSKVNQARATHEQFQAQRESVRRGAERRTRDAYLAVISGVARVKALQQAVTSSHTALEASETGLEVGTRTSVDVLNAQSTLYGVQRDYARARYDYLLAVLTLKSAAGVLVESDLREIDSLLTTAN